MRVDWQHRQHLRFGRAQRADAIFRPVTDGQMRYHVREGAAEWRILREGRVHGGRECPEWPDRLGSQPEDILAEPVRAGEPAAETGHGPHRGGGHLDHRGGNLCGRNERVQHRDVGGDPAAGRAVEPGPQPPCHRLGLGNRDQDRALRHTRKICTSHAGNALSCRAADDAAGYPVDDVTGWGDADGCDRDC